MSEKKELTPLDLAINAVGGSQQDLASALGYSNQAITNIKKRLNGNLPTKNPDLWVRATGLSKKELFPQFQD